MDLQGVHNSLHSAEKEVSHVEVVNDFDLAAEDFQQDTLDSILSLDTSPEKDNAMLSQREWVIKLTSLCGSS